MSDNTANTKSTIRRLVLRRARSCCSKKFISGLRQREHNKDHPRMAWGRNHSGAKIKLRLNSGEGHLGRFLDSGAVGELQQGGVLSMAKHVGKKDRRKTLSIGVVGGYSIVERLT